MSESSYPAWLYELLHRGTPGDLEFYRRQCEGASRVLELGCGYGRVLEHLAVGERQLVGLDNHGGLLSRAAERLGASAELRRGDMRNFELGMRFERVLIPYCGIFCLQSDEDVQACLRSIRRHLEPGGVLALDGYVGEAFVGAEPLGDEDELEEEVVTVSDGKTLWRVFERSSFEPDAQRLLARYRYVSEDGAREYVGSIPQRFLIRAQLVHHVEAAGFEIRWFGDGFDERAPYDEDGDGWSMVAVLPAGR